MMNTSPVLIAAAVMIALALIGAIVFVARQRRTFLGYRHIAADARQIATRLNGELFRDGEDLVISGEYEGIPTLVRFSNDENTPGMHLEVRVTSALHLSLNPKQLADNNVGARIKLNSWLDQRFIGRSKTAGDAQLLLDQRRTMTILARLCCSAKTVLEITPGKLDLLEMTIPASPAAAVFDRLADVRELEQVFRLMPGADEIKVRTIPRERSSWTFRATVTAGVVIAAVCVMAAMRERTQPVMAAPETADINGIIRADAVLIPMAEQWKLANTSDFDPAFIQFLGGSGQQASPRISVDLDGTGRNSGVVYFLTNSNGQKRIVVLLDHKIVFDTGFAKLAGLARVPASSFSRIGWDQAKNARPPQSSGDGILLIRDADVPQSAVVLYLQNGTLQSGAPTDYRNIGLD